MFAHARKEKDGLLAQGNALDACLLFAGLKNGQCTLHVGLTELRLH